MHGIIRQGNGKYYLSAVFGYYADITATDDYEKYTQRIHNPYWIVWDEKKERLIRWNNMTPNTKYLIPQIIIVDSDQSNWQTDDKGIGCVNFLSRELLDSILDVEQQPKDILNQCSLMDTDYIYEEIKEIKNQKDIDDIYWASGYFHDAYIALNEILQDGTLHLQFDGIWGCKLDVWFSGDLTYDTESRNSDAYDPSWFGATIILQDNFVFLIDDEDMTVDQITSGNTYFKARHMKYRIIPD